MSPQTEWYWEGNVVDAIASIADTRSRERGPDIHAILDGKELFIEAKGYPSKHYSDPNRAGQTKPTQPTLQAQHWYSHALLKVPPAPKCPPPSLNRPRTPRLSAVQDTPR